MRIIIDQNGLSPESDVGQGYTQIKSLSFSPSTGLLGESAAINTFSADIQTTEDIQTGDYARLRDDRENLWAQYWVRSAVRLDHKQVRITAQSDLLLLDRPTMPARFYSGETVSAIVREIFEAVGYSVNTLYELSPDLAGQTLTGFCPEQSARERLQSVCFAAGAYIQSYFCNHLRLLPVQLPSGSGTIIPAEKTYYRPTITDSDYVTSVSIKAYAFTQKDDPDDGEDYVTDAGGVNYVYTTEEITIENPDAQGEQFPTNVVSATDVMLFDRGRAAAAASMLAQYYFARTTVEAEVIDNGEYLPGAKVTVCGDLDRMYTGYITACEFSFGRQAKARLTIAAAAQLASGVLTVLDVCEGTVLNVRRYPFPVGYVYSISNDYIDQTADGVRTVYRPLSETVSGTMAAGGAEVTVEYAMALELRDGVLYVVSVDEIDTETDNDNEIGVIS